MRCKHKPVLTRAQRRWFGKGVKESLDLRQAGKLKGREGVAAAGSCAASLLHRLLLSLVASAVVGLDSSWIYVLVAVCRYITTSETSSIEPLSSDLTARPILLHKTGATMLKPCMPHHNCR